MRTILMSVFIVIAALAGAGTGYLYGVDQGKLEAQNIRTEFASTRAAAPAASAPSAAQTPDPNAQANPSGQGQQGQPRGGANQLLQRGTAGVIKSVQGNTLLVTAQDGSTVNVTMDANTSVQKMTAGATADLKAGERVTIQGAASGGNVTARLIIVGLGQ